MRSKRSLTFVALAASLGLITAIALATNLDGSRSQPPRTEVAAFDESLGPAPRTEVAAAQAPEMDLSMNARTAPADGGPGEAVRVHGHWTIEIREPDGSLVRTVEFENALSSQGAVFLAEVLGRGRSVGTWQISLEGPPPFACSSGTSQAPCVLGEPPDQPTNRVAVNFFPTLSVSVPASGRNAGKLVLAGTMTAQADGLIDSVFTAHVACGPNSPGRICNGISVGAVSTNFTGAGLRPSQGVAPGQQIQVTVVISFN